MIAENSQNTYSGGGAPVIAPTGNTWLDQLIGLANVGLQGASAIEDIQDRRAMRDIAAANAATPPAQAPRVTETTAPLQTITSAANTQSYLMAGIAFVVIGGALFFAAKKL